MCTLVKKAFNWDEYSKDTDRNYICCVDGKHITGMKTRAASSVIELKFIITGMVDGFTYSWDMNGKCQVWCSDNPARDLIMFVWEEQVKDETL